MLEERKVFAAPVLDASASPMLWATEGVADGGNTQVYNLVSGSISDPDGPPVLAIAITGVDNRLGTLQYRLQGTTEWLTVNADLINSQTNELALLLGETTYIRYLPFSNFNGSIRDGITFRAWDRSSGINGQYTVITSPGGNTAFSSASDTVEIVIRSVNEAPSFAPPQGTGKQIVQVGTSQDIGKAVVQQPDGRILIAGSSWDANTRAQCLSLIRLGLNGSLDPSFGVDGKTLIPMENSHINLKGLVLQPDGRILILGAYGVEISPDLSLFRLNPNGSLDTSFGSDGKVNFSLKAFFGEAGAVTLQPDGKIVVFGQVLVDDGTEISGVRLNANGSLDTTFDFDGQVTVPRGNMSDFPTSATVQSDGRILVAGYSYTSTSVIDFTLIRLNANGSLDTSFGSNGKNVVAVSSIDDVGKSVVVQPDGRILVAGYTGKTTTENNNGESSNTKSYNISLIRLNANGSLDTSFDADGKRIVPFESSQSYGLSATLQPDGRILVAGYFLNESSRNYDFALIRLNTDGSLDTDFDTDGKVLVAVSDGADYGNSITLQLDGRIIVAGMCDSNSFGDFCAIRVNSDGTLDKTFNDPLTSTLGGWITFTENGSPVVLDSDVRIYDPELSVTNFNGSTLTLFRNGGVRAEDLFSATGTLGALTQGGNLVLGGTTIGTVTINSGGTLVLTFNANATNALVNAAMQQIAYRNTETNPPDSLQIRWIFNDGNTWDQGLGNAMIAMDKVSVNINLINKAPVLDASRSPSLGNVIEGTANPAGAKVADIVVNGSITDADGAAVKAIAVTGINTSLGTMQYSLDDGSNWLTIDAAAINSQTDELALLLGPTAKLRLIPFGNLNGSINDAITFRAWDQRSSRQGEYTVITRTGGSTAFSEASDTADLTVTAVNSAPTFSPIQGTGVVMVSMGGRRDDTRGVSVRPDGRLLVGGGTVDADGLQNDLSAIRFNADGSLDSSFDSDGKLIIASDGGRVQARGMAVQPDERIVMVGVARPPSEGPRFGLVRLNPDGSFDSSFDSDGKANASIMLSYDYVASVIVQPDQKIVASGHSYHQLNLSAIASDDFSVVRLNPDGSLDTSFGVDGKVIVTQDSSEQAFASVLQSDGRLLVAGVSKTGNNSDFSVIRLNTDGTLDTSFDKDGKLNISLGSDQDIARSIVRQPDGRILLAGSCSDGSKNNFCLVRLNTDGSLDTSFDSDGKLIVPVGSSDSEAYGVTVQPDGRIVVVGRALVDGNWDASVIRLNSDGTLDTTFDNDGKWILPLGTGNDLASSVSVQPDGRIVVAGQAGGENSTSRYALVRLNADGSMDTTFNGSTSNTLGGSINFTEDQSPVVLDSDVQIFDADLSRTNFSGARLTLTREGGSNPQDLFAATGSLGGLTQGANLVIDGTTIGTVTTNSGGTLTLTFNANATNTLVNSAMQRIAYSNSSDTPPDKVAIVWTFSDGNSGSQGSGAPLTAIGSVTVNVTAVNDPPVANPDSFRMRSGSTKVKVLNILANDFDPDGSIDPSTLDFVDFENEFAAAALRLDGKIDFYLLNDPSFEGIIPFTYNVLDNEGLASDYVTVTIVVSDTPYQNPVNPFNVDDDSSVSPLDVLAIINLLNARGASIPVDDLPDSTDYVDVNGDNQVDPLDVLALINFINAGGNTNRKGEGEGEGGEASRAGWQKSLHRDASLGAPIVNIASIDGLSDAESKRQPARMLRADSGLFLSHIGTPAPRFAERIFEGIEGGSSHFDIASEKGTRDTDLVDLAIEELFLDRCA